MSQRELYFVREFNAPRALVWRAWTDPAMVAKWWGPKEYPASQIEFDVRPGGKLKAMLCGVEDGKTLSHHGTIVEVREPERLVFTFAWDEEGERGLETVVTLEFTEKNGKTQLVFRQSPFQSDGERDGHGYGWNSAFDRLDTNVLLI